MDWVNYANAYDDIWNFPFCCGAVDGKHVIMQQPAKSGSLFFNYKVNETNLHIHCSCTIPFQFAHVQLTIIDYFVFQQTNSIVLLAVVDASYKFIVVDIGQYGSSADGGVWMHSNIGQKLNKDKTVLPGYSTIPETNISLPHVFVGDEAFQLCPNFMRPYPADGLTFSQRIFNYRLSRAR